MLTFRVATMFLALFRVNLLSVKYTTKQNMDDSALTSLAIAELMRGISDENPKALNEPQERKINPLGRPNKKFLGRTINNALQHNKRTIERTHANCQQKLQELDHKIEKRKHNGFYHQSVREKYQDRRDLKICSKKKHKRIRSSSSSSEPHARSRTRNHKKKHKKKTKKKSKRKQRRRSSSSSSSTCITSFEPVIMSLESDKQIGQRSDCYIQSNNLALAVAIAYGQSLCKSPFNIAPSPVASSHDIIKELMSEDEHVPQDIQQDALSIASSMADENEILTIEVSSPDGQSVGSTATDSDSEPHPSSCSYIAIDSGSERPVDSGSDIEIVENDQLQAKGESVPELAELPNTVDLTDD